MRPLSRLVLLKLFIILSLVSISAFAANEPSSEIKGKVLTSDGQPAAFVSIQIKNKNRGTITDYKGEFSFKRLQSGHYTLQISLVGHETMEKEVDVEDGQVAAIVLQIQATNEQLEEVTVYTRRNKFANKETDNVARMPLENLENPQVYNVVGKELMKEQVIVERTDLYRNVPGAVPNFAAGGSQE